MPTTGCGDFVLFYVFVYTILVYFVKLVDQFDYFSTVDSKTALQHKHIVFSQLDPCASLSVTLILIENNYLVIGLGGIKQTSLLYLNRENLKL